MLLALVVACSSVDPATDQVIPGTTVENAPPILDVRFPPSGAIDSPVVAVFGTATDPEGGDVTVEVEGPEGIVSTDGSGAFRLDDVALGAEFDVTLRVIATDVNGATTEHLISLAQAGQLTERPDMESVP